MPSLRNYFKPSLPATDAAEAGRLYVHRGAISKCLLRDHVYQAWERSHLLKASALSMKAESLSEEATKQLIEREQDLIDAAEPYMKALSEVAVGMRHAAMLTDRNGILLRLMGDEETLHGPEPFPGVGTLLSEAVAGANGVGTTLAAGEYTELVGHEHFIRGFHPFTCQGIPIRDEHGEIVGSLSTSVRSPGASAKLRDLFLCASRGIEAEILSKRLERSLARVASSDPSRLHIQEVISEIRRAAPSFSSKPVVGKYTDTQGELSSVLTFLKGATSLREQATRRAKLWLELARPDVGPAGDFSVTKLLDEIVDLIIPDLSRRSIDLHWTAKDEAWTFGYRRALARRLLRAAILQIDESVEELKVGIETTRAGTSLLISLGTYSQTLIRQIERL